MPSFMEVCTSLEGMKRRELRNRRRDAFFHWDLYQFEKREKTGVSVKVGVMPSFIVVCSSLEGVKKRGATVEGEGCRLPLRFVPL